MNLFIDTNIFLSFYHFTKDELEELEKLIVMVKRQRITLLITDQVRDEFERNRSHKIADAIKLLQGKDFESQFPRLCAEYPEYGELRQLQDQYAVTKRRLIASVRAAAIDRGLQADSTMKKLFNVASGVHITNSHVEAASLRRQRGNPPGRASESGVKRRSFGDAINWQALLALETDDETLHFVSEDADWASPLDSSTFDEFLQSEWVSVHPEGEVVLYPRLSAFFGRHFPEIRLAEEAEKEIAIDDLTQSKSFKDTHRAVAVLRLFSEFTTAQGSRIARACLENDQVRQILGDTDIRKFVEEMLEQPWTDVDPEAQAALFDALMEVAEGRDG